MKKQPRPASTTPNVEFLEMSPQRLYMWSAFTLGLYDFYWFYKNWKAIAAADQRKMLPFWRTIFTIIFIWPLFKRIGSEAERHGAPAVPRTQLLALVYIVISIVGGAFGNTDTVSLTNSLGFLIVTFLSPLPLLPIQKVINAHNATLTPRPEAHVRSKGETVLMVVGVVLFGFVLLGMAVQ